MKRILSILLLCTVVFQGWAKEGFVDDSLKVDGYMRHFRVYLPKGIKVDAPLVIAAHGYGGHGVDHTVFRAADRHGFAVCEPYGLRDTTDHPGWNVGYPMQKGWKVNDVKFMCRLARYLQKEYQLSKDNCFFTGMSNGGEMCYLLAYTDQKVFRAIGSIAGLTMQWIYKSMAPVQHIPFLEIHGTEDRVSEWEGDPQNKGGWNPYLPVPLAVGTLVAHNRCVEEQRDTIVFPQSESKRKVVRHKYLGGKNNTEVWLYEVRGAGHSWFTDDMDTGEELWKFFSKYLVP